MAKDYYEFLPDFISNMDPEIYLSDNFLTLDLETTTKGDGGSPDATFDQNDIVCAAWKVHGEEEHFIRGGICDMAPLILACYEVDYIVAHNAKFDIKWLIRAGISPEKILPADTMLAKMVLTGNLRVGGANGGLSLGKLSTEYFGDRKEPFIDKLMRSGVCPSDMPARLLEDRNRKDIHQTERLWLELREEMIEEDVLGLFFTRCILSPVLADIELVGVHLDKKQVLTTHKKAKDEFLEVEKKLLLMLEGYSPTSPKQMREYIYDVLKFKPLKKRGIEWRPTGKEVLAFKAKTKKQKEFLELKKIFAQLNADLSKNLNYFYGVVMERDDAIFYAQFNQAQTVTHRLSSSGLSTKFDMYTKAKSIQLQNSPRKYKPLYSARNMGWKVIELDGAQIEFRVAGYIGQDVNICQDIINQVDVHTFTASKLNNCTEDEVREQKRTAPKGADWRTGAKADTFKPLYGGSYGTDAQMAYYSAFKEKYAGIAKAQKKWENIVLREKKIMHETGITFHFPSCNMSSSGYNPDFPSICNYPVQNLATAEVVPVAVVGTWHVLKAKEMQAFICNTVHDSEVIEAPEDELEEVYEIGKWAFLWFVYDYLDVVYDIQFNVPLGVGYQAGDYWGYADALPFTAQKEEGEFLTEDDGEVTVMAVPPTRMDGVDYSRLES